MKEQIHGRLTDDQVKTILKEYTGGNISAKKAMVLLSLKRSRFFDLAAKYRDNPNDFSIRYARETGNRRIGEEIEEAILVELNCEKKLIESPDNAIRFTTTVSCATGLPINNMKYHYRQ